MLMKTGGGGGQEGCGFQKICRSPSFSHQEANVVIEPQAREKEEENSEGDTITGLILISYVLTRDSCGCCEKKIIISRKRWRSGLERDRLEDRLKTSARMGPNITSWREETFQKMSQKQQQTCSVHLPDLKECGCRLS